MSTVLILGSDDLCLTLLENFCLSTKFINFPGHLRPRILDRYFVDSPLRVINARIIIILALLLPHLNVLWELRLPLQPQHNCNLYRQS